MLDWLSEFLAQRKGLLPLLGLALVAANWLVRFFFAGSGLAESDALLHLGIILAILGMLLGRAL